MAAMEWKELLPILRKERGLTQEELATALGISRQAVSKWEKGQAVPSADNLLALSRVYEMTVEELYQKRDGQSSERPADNGEQESETPSVRRSYKKFVIPGIIACACIGVLLWGKLTNSMALATGFLIYVAVLAFGGLLVYAALIVIIKIWKDIKK